MAWWRGPGTKTWVMTKPQQKLLPARISAGLRHEGRPLLPAPRQRRRRLHVCRPPEVRGSWGEQRVPPVLAAGQEHKLPAPRQLWRVCGPLTLLVCGHEEADAPWYN
jgi:hypothetical protein